MDAIPRRAPGEVQLVRDFQRYIHMRAFDATGARPYCDDPASFNRTLAELDTNREEYSRRRAEAVAQITCLPLERGGGAGVRRYRGRVRSGNSASGSGGPAVKFFTLSLLVYAGLVAWLVERVDGTTAEWTFTLGHLALAAAINAHLLWVARRRSLSFLGCAPLAFLADHLYFSLSALKYFSPILLYPQFDLSLRDQFMGSAGGGSRAVLRRARSGIAGGDPRPPQMRDWVNGTWPTSAD